MSGKTDKATETIPRVPLLPRPRNLWQLLDYYYSDVLRKPVTALLVFCMILCVWLSTAARTDATQQVLLVCCLLLGLALGCFVVLYVTVPIRRGCADRLSARFRFTTGFDIDPWVSVVRLAGAGEYVTNGRVRITHDAAGGPVKTPGYKPWKLADEFLRHIAGAPISGKVEPRTTATLEVHTRDVIGTRVVEQATFDFRLGDDARPCEVSVVIGQDMLSWNRKALFNRLCEEIAAIPGVHRVQDPDP